jgi:dTDP-4-amino-4,6-dideoxygalactose transaminase
MLQMNNLKCQSEKYKDSFLECISRVIDSGWYVLGGEVDAFEKEFSSYCMVENCITVANGTEALELALRALEIAQNDEVVCVANAGAYSMTAILAIGAKPLFVDIDAKSLLLSIEHLQILVRQKPKAIIVTHLYGQVVSMDDVLSLANEYAIPVIEDCAQAHGAMLGGRRVGSMGALGCFSFYPTKNLGALGDGGAITTNDLELAKKIRLLRQYGWESKYKIGIQGGKNSRLDELQASVLRVKLPYLDESNLQRYRIVEKYIAGISHPLISLPSITEQNFVAHLFVVQTSRRDALRTHLMEKLIVTDIHYPVPDHWQPAYVSRFLDVSLPVTEIACREVLSLPCYPEMTEKEIQKVIDSVNSWPER